MALSKWVPKSGFDVPEETRPRRLTGDEIKRIVSGIPDVFGSDKYAVAIATAQIKDYYTRNLQDIELSPIMINFFFALVIATFILLISDKNPILKSSLLRTRLI